MRGKDNPVGSIVYLGWEATCDAKLYPTKDWCGWADNFRTKREAQAALLQHHSGVHGEGETK